MRHQAESRRFLAEHSMSRLALACWLHRSTDTADVLLTVVCIRQYNRSQTFKAKNN